MNSLARRAIESFVMHLDRVVDGALLVEEGLVRKWNELADWQEEARYLVDDDENSEDRRDYEIVAAEEEERWLKVMPSFFRASLFISSYSALEHFLVSLCEHASPASLNLRMSDLRGDGIASAYTFLTKVLQYDLTDANAAWAELNAYRALRNILVHRSGMIPKDHEKAMVAFQGRVATFRIGDGGTIVLEDEFLKGFASTASAFAAALGNAPRRSLGDT